MEKTNSLQKLINTEPKEEELQERKEMMLKIRACELLLIEEELLADLWYVSNIYILASIKHKITMTENSKEEILEAGSFNQSEMMNFESS